MAASLSTFFSKFLPTSEHDKTSTSGREHRRRSDVNSNDPNKAWQLRVGAQQFTRIQPNDPESPPDEGSLRVVCISDTHTRLEKHGCLNIPDGDILLHAGDFTMYGLPDEVDLVNSYLGTLPHKHKVIIPGNHDMTFDLDFIAWKRWTHMWSLSRDNYENRLKALGAETVHELITNATYLQDAMVDICGVKIYGSPWQPASGYWGFNLRRGQACMDKWEEIPADTDILITHGPPLGHGDCSYSSVFKWLFTRRSLDTEHCGCVDLLNTIQRRVRPRYHVFGHIHEGYGVTTDGTTTFVNASTCDVNYNPVNPAIVFDISIPEGHTKDEPLKWVIKNKDIGKKRSNRSFSPREEIIQEDTDIDDIDNVNRDT